MLGSDASGLAPGVCAMLVGSSVCHCGCCLLVVGAWFLCFHAMRRGYFALVSGVWLVVLAPWFLASEGCV